MKEVMEETRHVLPVNSVAEFELVKAKNAIEQFIYSCSHTMRGPLKSIAGLVYLLKNSRESPDVDPGYYLHSIETTVIKLEHVLNDLEQFLTNSSKEISTRPVDVKALINDVLDDFRGLIDEQQIEVVVTVKQLVPLYTEQSSLRIILSHLISNAIVYQDIEKKNKVLNIYLKADTFTCIIHVKDNGIGMSDAVQSNIFRLFYRGSEKSTGSGVGLYIAHELITKMEGSIAVSSEPGKGSCFSVSIPNLSV